MASNKFEEMLEKLVNEDKAGAEELFHEIVVEKSRDIYESLLESDLEVDESDDEETTEATDEEVDEASDEEVDESDDKEVDESKDDKDEDVKEDFDLDEFEVEGGDAADDMMDKMGMDSDGDAMDMDMDMDDEEGSDDEEIEDRVDDLEVALDDLKAEFEKMLPKMDGDEGDDEADMDMDDEGDDDGDEEMPEAADEEVDEANDEEVDEANDEETDESTKSEAETMREYVEKVSAKMGDNGANTKSIVAGSNDMGGDASNLAQGAEETGRKADTAKEESHGNVNVPGGKASKSMKSMPKGHGAEKKGAGESGTDSKSIIGS
jgi:hypothetical protein